MRKTCAPFLLPLVLLVGMPAAAQVGDYGPTIPAASTTAEQASETARQTYSTAPTPAPDACARLEDADPDVIVVCREWESGEAYTFDAPTRADTEVTGSGVPRAPDVFGLPPCSSYTVCQRFGSVPPPAIMVDFASLPETPPDSDAARLYGGPTSDDIVTIDGEVVRPQAASTD
jgi:hypothetical protein